MNLIRLANPLLLGLFLCAVSTFAAGRFVSQQYQGRVERLAGQLAECAARREVIEQRLREQDRAIAEWQDKADAQRKLQQEAVQQARRDAEDHYLAALRILQETPEAGTDRCESARLAFDAELARERL